MKSFISSLSFLKYPAAVFFWLVVWHIASQIIANTIIIVSPIAAFGRLFELAGYLGFWHSIWATLSRIVLGFLIAMTLGVFIAATTARFRFFYVLTLPAFNILKAVPVASFIVMALMWINSQNLSVFIAFITVLPIVYFNCYGGIKSADAKLLEMARVFRVRPYKVVLDIFLPATLPHIIAAASSGLGLAFKAGIAAELIGLARGTIGFNLHSARVFLQTEDVFAWTIAIVLLSYCSEKLFGLLIRGLKDVD